MPAGTLYVDELNVFSLIWILRTRRVYRDIFYFDLSPVLNWLLPVLRSSLLKNTNVKNVKFHLSEIRSKSGECLFEKLYGEDPSRLCDLVAETRFPAAPLIRVFSNRFGADEIKLYLQKKIDRSIRTLVIFMHAARQDATQKGRRGQASPGFLFSHPYSEALAEYAVSAGLRPESYDHLFRRFSRYFRICARLVWPVLSLRGLFSPSGSAAVRPPVIGMGFNGKTITFDPSIRSDFFWLIPSSIDRSRVLMCFDRSDHPVTPEMTDILRNHGMDGVAGKDAACRDPRVPVFRPGPRSAWICAAWNLRILGHLLRERLTGGPRTSSLYVDLLLDAVRHYARWTEFFLKHGVKIYVHIDDFNEDSVPFHLALKDAGGVSVSYQYSSLYIPSRLMSICRDVYFAFGPDYRSLFVRNRSVIGNLVYSGYITDQAIALVKDRSDRHRRSLRAAGAEFILCFFDENSSEDRMCAISSRTTAKIYQFFLRAVLNDKTFGLIVKPGYPRTLFQRIPEIRDLAERAKSTGRCLFLDEGAIVTHVLPTEAAQAADVAVGFLFSGTAALESYLSGTPTIYLDLEKLIYRPEHGWTHRVAYPSVEELWSALTAYRARPDQFPRFGDLSPSIAARDPFRDGHAALRIGEYVRWVLESFDQGRSRDQAMESANRNYRDRWGADQIVGRDQPPCRPAPPSRPEPALCES